MNEAIQSLIVEHSIANAQLDLLQNIVALLESGCADDSTVGITATKERIVKLCEREQQRQLRRLDRASDRITALLDRLQKAAPPRMPARSVKPEGARP